MDESSEMEDLRTISLRQRSASEVALMRPELRLAPAQKLQIGELLANMAAGYPHQDMTESMPMYQRGLENLAVEFGTDQLQQALELLLTHRKFFPHPSEIREVLEEMAAQVKAKAKADLLAKLPKIGCEKCQGENRFAAGLVAVQKPGQSRIVDECECKLAWRRAKKELEAKA